MELRRIKASCYSVVCPTLEEPEEPPTIVDAVYLVYYKNFDGSLYAAGHAEDGAYLDDLGFSLSSTSAGRSIFPGPDDPHGQGTRVALEDGGSIVVLDFLNDQVYRYQPPAPWTAASPMLVGGTLYWFEVEAGATTQMLPIRLMQADDLVLSGTTVVRSDVVMPSIVVGEWASSGRPTRGHDFTDSHAALWVSWIDGNFESEGWERMVFPLDGGAPEQAPSSLQDVTPEVGIRAGLPIGSHQTLQQRTNEGDPQETEAFPLQQWERPDPEAFYSAWGDQPNAIDMALDRDRTRVYLLKSTQILIYDLGEQTLLSAVDLDRASLHPVGIHRLATPIPITLDSGGEEQGGEEE